LVPGGAPTDLDIADADDLSAYHAAMDGPRGYLLHEGLKRAMTSVTRGNEYVQTTQPWALSKDPAARAQLEQVLAALMRTLARQCVLLYPFVPVKTEELWRQLGGPDRVADQRYEGLAALDVTGWRVSKGSSLFPKTESPPKRS
jgi:methionyl-tRNA synthetase